MTYGTFQCCGFHGILFLDLQGEEEDREDDWYNDEEDSRTRRQKAQKIQATVPVIYNHNQHNISGGFQDRATRSLVGSELLIH